MIVKTMVIMEKYLTTFDVEQITSNLNQLEAFKCLGRMNDYATRYEEQLTRRYRWKEL